MPSDIASVVQDCDLSELTGSVEVMMIEATLNDYPGGTGHQTGAINLTTILVSFEPSKELRRAARAVAASQISAVASFHQAKVDSGVGLWMASLLPKGESSCPIHVVVSMRRHSPEMQSEIEAFIFQVRMRGDLQLGLTICVSEHAADWKDCEAFIGYVEASVGRLASDSLSVFRVINALQAPEQLMALDANDIESVIGTASKPSVVVRGKFSPVDDIVRYDSASGLSAIQLCTKLLVMPGVDIRARVLHRLVVNTRETAQANTDIVVVAVSGQVEPPLMDHESTEVTFICG